MNEILLAALLKSMLPWLQSDTLVLDLESHGRQDSLVGVNSLSTVGWFTSIFPVALQKTDKDQRDDWASWLRSVKQQLRNLPHQGFSYGILRYLSRKTRLRKQLAEQPHPQLSFNYWGQFTQTFAEDSPFQWGGVQLLAGPENQRTHLINLDCMIREGCFTMVWTYSQNLHTPETIQNLGKNYQMILTELVDHCLSRSAITQQSTDSLHSYPLTPLQQGLLFEHLKQPSADSYQVQLYWQIQQSLDVNALQKACQSLLDRHTVLRSSFHWEGLHEPIQTVGKNLTLPWIFHDWRALTSQQQEAEWAALLLADRQTPFDLQRAPLWRVTLVQLADTHYRIVWRMHHIVLDGWSVAILLAELEKDYHAYAAQQTPTPLPAPPFSEYVEWLQEYDWSNEKAFWETYLDGFSTANDLVITHTKCAEKNTDHLPKACFTEAALSAEHSQLIQAFARSEEVTLSTFFQGAWGALLYRFSQAEDLVFGVTTAGRSVPLATIEQRVGLFINTVPLRLRFNPTLTVTEYLTQLQQNVASLIAHSHTPLAHIHSWSGVSHNPQGLFDSIVVFENYPKQTDADFCDALEFWDPTHYALTLIILPGETIKIKLGYDAERITKHRAQQTLQLLQRLLILLVQNPKQPISQLPLVSMIERGRLLDQAKNFNMAGNKTVVDFFEAQAVKNPEAYALSFQDQHLSYQALNEHANALAHYLIHQGIEPETPIGLCLPKGIELIIGLLAIWKAGGVYTPLDPDYPPSRLRLLLSLSEIKTLITFEPIFEYMGGHDSFRNGYTIILLDKQQSELEPYSRNNPPHVNTLLHLAYLLYTSGTTGKPKAVAQEHKTLANLTQWQSKSSPAQKPCNITQFAAISFDVSLQEITYALTSGHHLHLVPPALKQSLTLFYAFLEEQKIAQLFLPTAFLEPFCEAGLFKKYTLDSLTDIFISGEALKVSDTIRQFFACHTQIRLTNQYGPTETHVVSSYVLPADSTTWPRSVPIGTPIDHTMLYILDSNQQLVPYGLPGELCVGGAGVARGYLGDLEKTEERFIVNPLRETPARRLYRTGDKVRWNNEGQLEYEGRFDQQIKIRGYRIEPAEIESRILDQFLMRECRIIAKPDHLQTMQLIAYMVPYPRQEKSNEEIIAILQKKLATLLPDYMLPAHYLVLEAFPLTRHGKIDLSLLPEPAWQLTEDSAGTHSARHIFDRELSLLWLDVLGTEPKSIETDFFSAGGNSLSALRLMLAIEKQFQVQLTVSDLLLAPTLAKLSDRIQQLQASALLAETKSVAYKGRSLAFPIIPLHTSSTSRPLFIIHPVGGTVFWFVDLARYLRKDRPVYGIQDPGVIRQEKIFDSIEEMAHFYLQCMRQIQPRGPYSIAGASFGATVAFAIAKQLEQQGESADFVGLLDGWAFYPQTTHDQKKFKKLMRKQCEELYQRFHINELENANAWVDLQWHRNTLLWKYTLQPLNTPLTLFKAQELKAEMEWAERADNYWTDYTTKELTIIPIPGDHASVFDEPNVQVLAEEINNCLSTEKIETQ